MAHGTYSLCAGAHYAVKRILSKVAVVATCDATYLRAGVRIGGGDCG